MPDRIEMPTEDEELIVLIAKSLCRSDGTDPEGRPIDGEGVEGRPYWTLYCEDAEEAIMAINSSGSHLIVRREDLPNAPTIR